MKVTFPHLGTMHIFCKAIAETAGIDYILPPKTSKRTLTLGVKNSNECICLPFKIILGNFIEPWSWALKKPSLRGSRWPNGIFRPEASNAMDVEIPVM
jgi:hypothetical protein